MAIWEQILLGLMSVLLLFWFWPGTKKALAESRQTEDKDWLGVLIPIGIVVLFVIILIVFAAN